jgi:hypothetical protein
MTNTQDTYRASIRIHEPGNTEHGEFVSVHTTLASAQRELTALHNAFGGRRVTPNILIRTDGRTYRVWQV